MSNMTMTVAEFTRLLEVYGAERTRWPAEARAAAAHLIAVDRQARRLLAEIEALDHVLEHAPVPAAPVEAALAERIIAAAQRSPRVVRLPGARPTPADAAQAQPVGPPVSAQNDGGRQERAPWRAWWHGREVAAAGLLAASLVMGVVIGNTSLPSQLLPGLSDMAGLISDRDDLVKVALSDEVMQ
ncbi:MAG TPA: hypothetical protein VFY92_08895 [Hyphomicrobiaceae bacterium]|nr:hypothetical protein [Hyphomicrobiaceae bacterium]